MSKAIKAEAAPSSDDNRDMISLFAVLGVFGGGAVLSGRFGADSRRPNDRNW
jgi:hypothetical protein